MLSLKITFIFTLSERLSDIGFEFKQLLVKQDFYKKLKIEKNFACDVF